MRISDWSSDVCSSDLRDRRPRRRPGRRHLAFRPAPCRRPGVRDGLPGGGRGAGGLSRALRIAVGAYDRTLPLMAGLVGIDGVAAEYVTAPLEEIFARAFDEHSYDVTELSFSNYLYLTATEGCPYVGLPVFPSRSFRPDRTRTRLNSSH